MIQDKKSSHQSFINILKSIPAKYSIHTCKLVFNLFFIDPKSNSFIYLEERIFRCPICLQEVMTPIKPNNCRHVFCRICLTKWMKNNPICPVCRTKIDKYSKVDLKTFEISSQLNDFAICFDDEEV